MLCNKTLPVKVRTNNALTSLNTKIKRLTHFKSYLSWREYIEILLKLEKEYKEKIITIESSVKIKIKKKINCSNSISKNNNIYFFKWKYDSCRFDSLLFILKFKLINIFANSNLDITNQKLLNLFSYCNELSKFKPIDFEKGFFDSYSNLSNDYLSIKNNLNSLKHNDTISSACIIFDGIDELISKYRLTELCTKCNPFGKTVKKKII